MTYFKKIDNSFLRPSDNWWQFKSDEVMASYGLHSVTLDMYKLSNVPEFKNLHTKKFFSIPPYKVSFTILNGKGLLAAHRDHGVSCSLNYYIQANVDDVTQFYNGDSAIPFTYPGKETANMYIIKDLVETEKFSAGSNEAYLLNVSEIHSVMKYNDLPRIFIAYCWKDVKFQEVLNDIESHIGIYDI